MKGKAWTPVYVIGAIIATMYAFQTWFGDFQTERWLIGALWFGMALRGIMWALEPWMDDEMTYTNQRKGTP